MRPWTLAVLLVITPALAAATNETKVVFAPKWKLQYLTVPKVQFRDADPRAVIKYLQDQSGKLSPDHEPINVVWLIAPDQKLPRITLNLANIPLEEAVKYVVRAARLSYRVDAHAVVIEHRSRPPAEPNAPAR